MSRKKKYTDELKREVIDAYVDGVLPNDLCLQYGIHRNTILMWARELGVKPAEVQKSRLLPDEPKTYTSKPLTLSEMKAMRKQEEIISAESVAMAASTPADAFNSYMAETVMGAIQRSAEVLPKIKTWADFERANKIMRQALGLDTGNNKSGIGGRISLDVNVITGKAVAKTVDAEVVSEG